MAYRDAPLTCSGNVPRQYEIATDNRNNVRWAYGREALLWPGLFAAGDEPGTFADTVEVTVTDRGITLRATAPVIAETGAVAKAS